MVSTKDPDFNKKARARVCVCMCVSVCVCACVYVCVCVIIIMKTYQAPHLKMIPKRFTMATYNVQ